MTVWTGTGTPAAAPATSAYALETARTTLKARFLWLTQKFTREPLEGLVDSSNKLFHLRYAPAQADSVTIYDADGALVAAAGYTTDDEAGSVTFGSAPTGMHSASYTYQALTDTQVLNLCKEGFDAMQRVYARALYLVSSGGYNYVSSAAATATDPTLGAYTFSTSRRQIELLLTCCEWAVVKALVQQAGVEAVSFREGITGMQVDRSKRVASMTPGLDEIVARIMEAVYAAADEAGDTTMFEGGVSPGARSDTWYDWFDWHTGGMQDMGLIT